MHKIKEVAVHRLNATLAQKNRAIAELSANNAHLTAELEKQAGTISSLEKDKHEWLQRALRAEFFLAREKGMYEEDLSPSEWNRRKAVYMADA